MKRLFFLFIFLVSIPAQSALVTIEPEDTVAIQSNQIGTLDPFDLRVDGGAPPLFASTLIRGSIFTSEGGPVPNGSTINSAMLTLTKTAGSADMGSVRQILPPASGWVENTVLWDTFGGGSGGTSGIDFAATGVDFSPGIGDTGTNTIDITPIVSLWSGGSANDGVIIVGLGFDGFTFESDDSGTPGIDVPMISVDYTAIPEPSAFLLFGLIGGVVGGVKWWRKRK